MSDTIPAGRLLPGDVLPYKGQGLLAAVADFVTPGDLLNCESLMTMGKIQM